MDLRHQVDGYPGTEPAAFARLNLALCAMHFGDFAAAHEHLLKARGELPQRAGLSQGTALYYLGLALERLGYAKEAADAYRAAAAAKDATLFDNDGPLVRRAGAPPGRAVSAALPARLGEPGRLAQVDFPLTARPLTVGRDDDADIRVDEPLVSRLHARIERRGHAYVVLRPGLDQPHARERRDRPRARAVERRRGPLRARALPLRGGRGRPRGRRRLKRRRRA